MRINHSRLLSFIVLVMLILSVVGCASNAPSVQPNTAEAQVAVQEQATKTGPFKGMQAPDFKLVDMDGTEWSLSQLKGNSVALVFFTSW